MANRRQGRIGQVNFCMECANLALALPCRIPLVFNHFSGCLDQSANRRFSDWAFAALERSTLEQSRAEQHCASVARFVGACDR